MPRQVEIESAVSAASLPMRQFFQLWPKRLVQGQLERRESPSEDTDRLTTGDPVGLGRGQDPDASSRQGETKRPRIMRR
jgi:hypothetical protein